MLPQPADDRDDRHGCQPWVFINAGAQGYFRTAYARTLLRALAPDLADVADARRALVARRRRMGARRARVGTAWPTT